VARASATVDPSRAGMRLDQLVAQLVVGSVHAARRLIADGRVTITIDGRAARSVKKGARLIAGQTVDVELERKPPDGDGGGGANIPDPGMALSVLYCDDDLVALNKPAGIASHPLRPGEMGTLANALVARFPECAGAGGDAREGGLGHRLDRETSGVLLAARRRDVWLALRRALKDPDCEKSYLAEVVGQPAVSGSLAAPIGRQGRRGRRVRVGEGRNPLPAFTAWEVIAAHGPSTLLRARLHAGRAHQVRAHLAAIGHPILGDALYGDAAAQELAQRLGVESLRLHAESVRLRHPVSNQPLVIEAPPPEWVRMPAA
jgi:23S rRNA pseudouridine1911/1915/1917 synthase